MKHLFIHNLLVAVIKVARKSKMLTKMTKILPTIRRLPSGCWTLAWIKSAIGPWIRQKFESILERFASAVLKDICSQFIVLIDETVVLLPRANQWLLNDKVYFLNRKALFFLQTYFLSYFGILIYFDAKTGEKQMELEGLCIAVVNRGVDHHWFSYIFIYLLFIYYLIVHEAQTNIAYIKHGATQCTYRQTEHIEHTYK